MSAMTKQMVYLLDMLPEQEQSFACEMLRKLVLAWDPDFTKLTPDEAKRLEIGRKQLEHGEYCRDDEIDWDNLDKMDLN